MRLIPTTSAALPGRTLPPLASVPACASSNSSWPKSATRTRAAPTLRPQMNSWPGAPPRACRRSPRPAGARKHLDRGRDARTRSAERQATARRDPPFARIRAALGMIVEDVFRQNRRLWVRLREKGGKRHAMPSTTILRSTSPAISTAPACAAIPRGCFPRDRMRRRHAHANGAATGNRLCNDPPARSRSDSNLDKLKLSPRGP
jgi:hypothetical protein